MNQTPGRFRRIDHVELRVRDLAQSAAFYERLLGLTKRREWAGASDRVSVYLSDSADAGAAFSIVLVEGMPTGMEIAGLDHICLEVSTPTDVDEIHAAAIAAGSQATSPRIHLDRYQTYVFDPNGYKIEIATRRSNGTCPRD